MSDEVEVALDLDGETVTVAWRRVAAGNACPASEVRRFESAFEDLREQMVTRCASIASRTPTGS